MSTFLYGPMLSAKINELLSEACTCIVSYIGDGATQKIKGLNKSKKVRVIYNFHSNGTNPTEVERLINFLGTDKVKDMDSFHAKVYFSDSGAIACSANFSTNGFELFNEPAKQLEAGVFIGKNEAPYKKILEWHISLKNDFKEITLQEIQERKLFYKIQRNNIKKLQNKQGDAESGELRYLLEHAKQFFVCNTDRRQGERTPIGGYALEQEMYNRGYATA